MDLWVFDKRGYTAPLISKLMKENNKKIIIFDMDGTLYKFKGDSFKNSGLYDIVIENTLLYISNKLKKSEPEAKEILELVFEKYGNSISIGLEKEFKIDRHDYFDFAWNIEAKNYVQFDSSLKPFLLSLENNFDLALLSDAPKIWVHTVLDYLGVKEIFKNNIFSGEGNVRKEFGNAFEEICKIMNIEAHRCIAVGDQEETDIIPAKKIGMKTVFVGENKSNISDYTIDNIFGLKEEWVMYEK